MKRYKLKPALFVKKGTEIPLSGSAVLELLRAVLDKGLPFRFQAKGFSMSPFIKDHDIITVFPLSQYLPTFGDVVAFLHPRSDRLVVHRIVGKRDNSYLIIKGDSMPEADGLVPKEKILGRVMRVERDGHKVFFGLGPERFLVAFLSQKGVFITFIGPLLRFFRPILRRQA